MNNSPRCIQVHKTLVAYKTVSTLLIPSKYLTYFEAQCKLHKSQAKYFQYLFCKFENQIKHYKHRMINEKKDKWKTHYQNEGLQLNRCNFRPNPLLWEQCRHTAGSFGVSMCYLFIFLMKLEMDGICMPKKKNSRMTINNNLNIMEKFFTCIRRVDFYPKKLTRKLIFKC